MSRSKARAKALVRTVQVLAHAELPPARADLPDNLLAEVLRGVARDVCKTHGIPSRWLSCEVLQVGGRGDAEFVILMTIEHWDDALPGLASPFEAVFMSQVMSFSLQTATRIRALAWRVSPDAGCPHHKLPDASFWADEAVRQRDTARRRAELDRLIPDDIGALSDFAPTEPVGLMTEPMALEPRRRR